MKTTKTSSAMPATAQRSQSFQDFGINFNTINIDFLFRKYEEIGFIYPEKKALLKPHFSNITQNWKRLLNSSEQLLWVLHEANSQDFSSISVFKNANRGLLAQHLVSNGNPFLSLKVMLAAQFKAEHHYTNNEVRSSQNWFRPNNRYAYRIFASMFEKLGPEKAALIPFQYMHLSLDKISYCNQSRFHVEDISRTDPELIHFVNNQYGKVFTIAEELDQMDIRLSKLGATFQKYSLHRSRKVLKIKDSTSGKTIACIVANRAPLGLNFSYIENRAYYILNKNLDDSDRAAVLKVMNQAIKPYYTGFELGAIPIVTDDDTSAVLAFLHAKYLRTYMQSIWLREGFSQWYHHINSFLTRIEERRRK